MWTRGMCVLLVFLHVIAGSAAYVSSQRQILQGGVLIRSWVLHDGLMCPHTNAG